MNRGSAPQGAGVAFVLASYAPDTPAGMERATAALAGGLGRIGHRPIIITAATPRPSSPQVVTLDSLPVAFPADDRTLRDTITSAGPAIRAELTAILDDREIDVVVYVDALWGIGRLTADHPARTVLMAHVLGHPKTSRPRSRQPTRS
jgi:hypothetical protein